MKDKIPIEKLEKLRKWATDYCTGHPFYYGKDDLSCGCATLAYLSYILLKKEKIPVIVRENKIHAFVTVGSDIIVDLTATQFDKNLPNVFIKEKQPDEIEEYYYKVEESGKNNTEIRKIFKEWSKSQNPFRCLKKMDKPSKEKLEEILGTTLKI
jgi:hypothetical protein